MVEVIFFLFQKWKGGQGEGTVFCFSNYRTVYQEWIIAVEVDGWAFGDMVKATITTNSNQKCGLFKK